MREGAGAKGNAYGRIYGPSEKLLRDSGILSRQTAVYREKAAFVSLLEAFEGIAERPGQSAARESVFKDRDFAPGQTADGGTEALARELLRAAPGSGPDWRARQEWCESVQEAVSYLDTGEWKDLWADLVSADPLVFARVPASAPIWEQKHALAAALEEKRGMLSRGRDRRAGWEAVLQNSRALLQYLGPEAGRGAVSSEAGGRRLLRETLFGMPEREWRHVSRELERIAGRSRTEAGDEEAGSAAKAADMAAGRAKREPETLHAVSGSAVFSALSRLMETDKSPIRYIRGQGRRMAGRPETPAPGDPAGYGAERALLAIERRREERMAVSPGAFGGRAPSGEAAAGLRRQPPVYDAAGMVMVQGQAAGAAKDGPAPPPGRAPSIGVFRQEQEQTDIQFVTRQKEPGAEGLEESRRSLESLLKQAELQKKELSELARRAERAHTARETSQVSRTVMKKIEGQLRMEQLRQGL